MRVCRCQGPTVALFMQTWAKGAWDRIFRFVISLDLFFWLRRLLLAQFS